jgi:ABC-2 type transport system ATP-binding protein
MTMTMRTAEGRHAAARTAARTGDETIRLRGLRKSFGPVRAVDGIDLSLERGRTVAILGRNGAGKSTALSRGAAGALRAGCGRQPGADRAGRAAAALDVDSRRQL